MSYNHEQYILDNKQNKPIFEVGDWITDGLMVWQHKDSYRGSTSVMLEWKLWKPQEGEMVITNWRGKYIITEFNDYYKDNKIYPIEYAMTLKD